MSHSHAIDKIEGPLISAAREPGHWVLARAGKRVLRPGGAELTRQLLGTLNIRPSDTVIELAPGLGHTAEKVLALKPFTYLGVDREPSIVRALQQRLGSERARFVQGSAENTGLPGEAATLLFGEAILSMQSDTRRKQIVEEAWRVLRCCGRYGIHELCVSSDVTGADRRKMEADLAKAIHHGVRLLNAEEWRELMESAGFRVTCERTAPMKLLDIGRIVKDEGLAGAARFAMSTLTHPDILKRVVEMRRVFHRHQKALHAIALVCEKEY